MEENPLNRIPEIQEDDSFQAQGNHQQQIYQDVGTPDLALNLQALCLSAPRICTLQATRVEQSHEIQEKYMLLMKVACTGGTQRIISEHAINQAMARAWRQHFYAISQVSTHLFMAYFISQEDMLFVFTRQPWMMGADNLLLEWIDPDDESKTKEDYKFEYIYVTIRAYGIPKEARSLQLLQDILFTVGEPSEFHPLQSNMLFSRAEYIWGTAKLKVSKQVVDQISLTLPDKTTTMVFLHYEKIGRICLFCGIMFHNAQHCPLRNEWIMERAKSRKPVHDIPFTRFGEWLIDSEQIPKPAIKPRGESSSVLSRFQRMFKEEEGQEISAKRGVASSTERSVMAVQRSPREEPFRIQHQGILGALGGSGFSQFIAQEPRVEGRTVHPSTHFQGSQINQSGVAANSITSKRASPQHPTQEMPASKRPAPDGGDQNVSSQIHSREMRAGGEDKEYRDATDKPSQVRNLVTGIHYAKEVDYPTLPDGGAAPTVATGEAAANSSAAGELEGNKEATDPGIGRAEDATTGRDQIVDSSQRGEPRRRASGWDVLPPTGSRGSNSGDPRLPLDGSGGPIRNHRNYSKKMGRGKSPPVEKIGSPYTTRCSRLTARVNSLGGDDYDPWPIHTPSPTSSTGTPGSRDDAFSPPTTVSDSNLGMDVFVGYGGTGATNQVQGLSQNSSDSDGHALPVLQAHLGSDMDVDGALALALKAPRAP